MCLSARSSHIVSARRQSCSSREDVFEAMVAIGFQLSNDIVSIALAANASVFIELCNEVTESARRQQPWGEFFDDP